METELFTMRQPHEIRGLKELIKTVERKLGRGLCMVEVGSYAGESSEIWAQSGVFNSVICVDIWKSGYDNTIAAKTNELAEKKFDEVAAKYPDIIHKMKCDSITASKTFADNMFDLVYIDAEHSYDAVKRDIAAWLPKIKKGRIISGHDFNNVSWKGVVNAVVETLGKPDATFEDTSWLKIVK